MMRSVVAAWLLATWSGPALAQDVFCRGIYGVDFTNSRMLMQMLNQPDQQSLGALAGTWYSETHMPDGSQVSYLYQRFEPNGLYSYQNRVCGAATGTCNDYAGHGQFGVTRQGDGSLFALVMVSDLQRDHVCTTLSGRVNGDQFTGVDGQAMRRVGL